MPVAKRKRAKVQGRTKLRKIKKVKTKKRFVAKKVKVPIVKKAKKAPTPAVPERLRREVTRISIGIPGVERITEGIERGSAFLVYGTPHCGKKPFLMQTAYAALKRKVPVIFILTDHGVKKWREMMESGRWSLNKFPELVYFVDCYSKQHGFVEEKPNISYLEVPFVLSALSIECTKMCEMIERAGQTKPLVIFHSLSTLIQEFGEAAVYDFLQFFVGKLRGEGITSMFSLQYGMHDEKTTTAMLALMDGVAEMRDEKIRFVNNVKSRDWFPYIITKRGIKILKRRRG